MPYLTDGDVGFVGLDSRSNPAALPSGYVQRSENYRYDRGVARVRGGLSIAAPAGTYLSGTPIASGVYSYQGVDKIAVASTSKLDIYNTSTKAVTALTWADTVAGTEDIDFVQAGAALYVLRGTTSGNNVQKWDGSSTLSDVTNGSNFPLAKSGVFQGDRIAAVTGETQIKVSNYLAYDTAADWNALNVFEVASGGGDAIIRLFPWQNDKVLIFNRNSIHVVYLSSGDGTSDGSPSALGDDAYLRLITNQFGTVARRSVCAAGQYVFFLNDSGIHMLDPQLDLALVGKSEPLSAPIADVTDRLSSAYASGACGAFWNNRLYFAVPINDEAIDVSTITTGTVTGTHYAYVTTASAHGYSTGDVITVSGSNVSTFNATATVTVTSTTEFNFTITAIPTPNSSSSPNLVCNKVATRNNRVLVYSLLNKAWESVDSFETGVYVDNLLVANYLGRKRLHAVSAELGICVYEELAYGDNKSTASGLSLPFTLPAVLLTSDYDSVPVRGRFKTRRYTYGSEHRKRYSAVEITGEAPESALVSVNAISVNPDVTKAIYTHTPPSSGTEDFTARARIAMNAQGLDIEINSDAQRTAISSVTVEGTQPGRSLKTET